MKLIELYAISIIVLSLLVGFFMTWVARLEKKNNLFSNEILNLDSEIEYLSDMVEDLVREQEERALEKTDGFLKFVSDSRDWAFSYIEDVQGKLANFDNKITEILDVYSLEPGEKGVPIDILKEISEAYAELKSALPKENGKV